MGRAYAQTGTYEDGTPRYEWVDVGFDGTWSGPGETPADTPIDWGGILKNFMPGNASATSLAGTAGIALLLNKLMGDGGGGGFSGYKGGIPRYVANRTQLPIPKEAIVTPAVAAQKAVGPTGYNVTDQQKKDLMGLLANEDTGGIDRYAIANRIPQAALSAIYPTATAGEIAARHVGTPTQYDAIQSIPAITAPRRPGSGGITYFSPMSYSPYIATPPAGSGVDPNAPAGTVGVPTYPATDQEPVVNPTVYVANGGVIKGMARGGISSLGGYSDGGQLLRGPGDGVSDSIPATIGGKQKAALADGEFVVPARIVSELGNGSTEAGARKLYAMMDRINKARRKVKNVATNSKADKHLPA